MTNIEKPAAFSGAERFFVFVIFKEVIMAEQESGIFRKQALERITTPEQFTKYLRVTTPGIWVLLTAIIILLGGLIVWSTTGTLETLADGVADIKDGQATIMVSNNNGNDITSGMTVRIGEDNYTISTVQKDDYSRNVAYAPISKADGKYDVRIVTQSIHPIQFLFD